MPIYKDGKGNLRDVAPEKESRFKSLFPGAQLATEEELDAVELKRAKKMKRGISMRRLKGPGNTGRLRILPYPRRLFFRICLPRKRLFRERIRMRFSGRGRLTGLRKAPPRRPRKTPRFEADCSSSVLRTPMRISNGRACLRGTVPRIRRRPVRQGLPCGSV